MDLMSFLDWGIAAVFAIAMFFIWRHSCHTAREDRKFMEDRLTKVLEDYNNAFIENTRILSELYTWLKARNGHK